MFAAAQTIRSRSEATSSSIPKFLRQTNFGRRNGQNSNIQRNQLSRHQVFVRTPGAIAVSIKNKSLSAIESRREAQRRRDEQLRNAANRLKGSAQSAPVSSGGEPLSMPVRQTLEQSFRVNLSQVRVHNNTQAQNMAGNLSARAFTVGNNIFLGAGERASDLSLMAHETAHVVQQQGASAVVQKFTSGQEGDSHEREAQQASAAVMRGASFTIQGRTSGSGIQRFGLGDILDGLAELAANVPGFTLLTVIIGRNPINQRVVERNFTNLLRGFMGLIPGGEILFQVINHYGIVERIGQWTSNQLGVLGLNYQYIRERFSTFTGSLGLRDLISPSSVWRRAQEIFTEPITRIRNFVTRLIGQAITWLKETFMPPLSNFCREIPGYSLVKVLLGRDPFTNESVPRSALNVVRAFAEFIPGGTEKVNQLVESNALQRASAWFIEETQARNLTWARISGTFSQAWNALRLEDVLHPIDTLRRMVGMFRPLMSDLVGFAGAALMKLLEFIFEAVMGAGGNRVLAILKRARATFLTIIRNPVGFLRNLLGAVGQGVRQFRANILRHLREGVIAWLTGPVARAGIQMPERWDVRGVIWFVLQILGLTWQRVREKLVRLMGERAVGMLEAGFQLIQDIRQRGLVQALRDRVAEFFGQLREAALGGIRTFIQQRLVMAGITQLVSLLNPVGAVIQAIIKTYTTIQFFIERINQILDLVESVVNSVSAIASGAIGQAANFVERTMARTIPVILDFLARFIGLGDVGGHIQRTIQGLQARVDQMLDRAVDWIRERARSLLERAAGGAPQQRLDQALTAGQAAVNRFAGRRVGAIILRPLLAALRIRYQLRTLEAVPRGNRWAVRGVVNPEGERPTDAQVEGATPAAGAVNFGDGVRFSAGREAHRVWVAVTDNQAVVKVASGSGKPGDLLIQELEEKLNEIIVEQERRRASELLEQLRARIGLANRQANREIQSQTDDGAAPSDAQAAQTRMLAVLQQLSPMLADLFVVFGLPWRLIAAAAEVGQAARGKAARARGAYLSWLDARARNGRPLSSSFRDKAFAAVISRGIALSGTVSVLNNINRDAEETRILNSIGAGAAMMRELIATEAQISGGTHAEEKLASVRPNLPIGIHPENMCGGCRSRFLNLARSTDRVQVITGPEGTNILLPSGGTGLIGS